MNAITVTNAQHTHTHTHTHTRTNGRWCKLASTWWSCSLSSLGPGPLGATQAPCPVYWKIPTKLYGLSIEAFLCRVTLKALCHLLDYRHERLKLIHGFLSAGACAWFLLCTSCRRCTALHINYTRLLLGGDGVLYLGEKTMEGEHAWTNDHPINERRYCSA